MTKATLYTDGGARGNPGPAGIGYVLKIEGQAPLEEGVAIGEATNNQAEYEALKRGLTRAKNEGVSHLTVYMDSELVIKQISGEYRVKNKELQSLHQTICSLIEAFEKVIFTHVPRVKNKRADYLVNAALDKLKN